ncbi:MAG: hypothetical protein A2V59_05285 [Armatimonadetes bacterium RBG_19FT_COMBO_69_19]|nr:MAG: hypothetical protein A2V59_05285 [Armatimonadetes bacterium RBG_19FT_COMBO_69_19]
MGTGRVLTGVGLAAVLAAIVVALLANTSNPPSGQSASPGLRVPDALAGTPLSAAVRGSAAVEEVSRLHGRRIEASDAVVARYGPIALWISASPSPLKASALLWRMNRRMAGGTRVFSDPRPQEMRGRTVFGTDGLGQRHLYYQSGAYVLWLAAPADAALQALEELLTLYP